MIRFGSKNKLQRPKQLKINKPVLIKMTICCEMVLLKILMFVINKTANQFLYFIEIDITE